MPRQKKSYGLICCRYSPINKKIVEIIMVKKTCTYAYCAFVFGKYKKPDTKYLRFLFSNMTFDEKMLILTMQYNKMWQRVYLDNPEHKHNRSPSDISRYQAKKQYFNYNFTEDGGIYLKKIINLSQCTDTLWEFPKGHSDTGESDMRAGIREFTEETGISSMNYKIMWHTTPYTESFVDAKVCYKNKYYFARAMGVWSPKIWFDSFKQVSEVSQVKWVCLDEIKYMSIEPKTKIRIVKLFKQACKIFRHSTKLI